MPTSKAQFKNAFRQVVSSQFSQVPLNENEIDFIFSQKFEKRMAKLINSQKKPYYKLIDTTFKRVAIIFILILTMFTTAFSVKAIRLPILEFVKQIYETFIHYSVDGKTEDKITEEYSLTYVPEGFNQTNIIKNDSSITTIYENMSGEVIEFLQMITEIHLGYFLDNEAGNIDSEMVKGTEVQFKEWHGTKNAVWTEHGYVFIINCYCELSFDDIKQMIISIE